MSLLSTISSVLNKPFPEEESRFGAPKTVGLVSVFVVFVLYVFQPFGISTLEEGKFWICLGFGVMTFLAAVTYEFVVGQLFHLKASRGQWTFWKWIVNNFMLMLVISLANFLFARLVIFGYIQWEFFPDMMYGTLMIGVVPIILLGAWAMISQERRNLGVATELNNRSAQETSTEDLSEVSVFDIPLSKFRYAEALQNYVKIGYVDDDGHCVTKTERATLKQLLAEANRGNVVRSHRSFLVNRSAIISAEGNAQGLLLTLADCDISVPVSRSYVPAFRSN